MLVVLRYDLSKKIHPSVSSVFFLASVAIDKVAEPTTRPYAGCHKVGVGLSAWHKYFMVEAHAADIRRQPRVDVAPVSEVSDAHTSNEALVKFDHYPQGRL